MSDQQNTHDNQAEDIALHRKKTKCMHIVSIVIKIQMEADTKSADNDKY